jgi:DNA-binding winged helix-turn-helix (wHTH) protein/TolB-like protein/Flp pilus assembly protein TadD
MSESELRAYRFGPYRIDTAERLLRRADELIPLPPKVIDTLLVLVAGAGRMVDKGELIKAVWPDTFVEEGALTRNVSVLRKALGDTKDEGSYIETIPKRGYRFVAAVRMEAVEISQPSESPPARSEPPETRAASPSSSPLARWAAPAGVLLLAAIVASVAYVARGREAALAAPSVRAPENTLAVLPFRNVNEEAGQEYFADGMTQSLVAVLAKLGSLRVISLASQEGGRNDAAAVAALRDPSITRVLSGTVLRSGGHIHISVVLKDSKTGFLYWTNNYDRDIEDVLSLQSEVAQAIANEIQVTVTPEDKQRLRQNRQVKREALDAYLHGRYAWNRRTEDGMRKAAEFFQQAIDADPYYAAAYSGLADSYSMLGSIGIDGERPNDMMPKAKAAALKAIQLDKDLAEAHASLGYVMLSYDWDLAGARQEFLHAITLDQSSANAHHWYSHYFMAKGELGKATEEMQAAFQLEPLSSSINIGIGWCYYYGQQYQQAIEQYRTVVETDQSFPMAHQTLGMAYQQKGMMDKAIAEFQSADVLSGGSPGTVAGLATAYAAAGQRGFALDQLARLEELSKRHYVPAFYMATIYFALDDLVKTFQFGKTALHERSDYLMYLRVEPRASKLLGNQEFTSILALLHP